MILDLLGYPERSHFLVYIEAFCGALAITRRSTHIHLQKTETNYSLRSIILFANMNVSRYILVLDTSVLTKSNMNRRE
jgi:hypothetical protein